MLGQNQRRNRNDMSKAAGQAGVVRPYSHLSTLLINIRESYHGLKSITCCSNRLKIAPGIRPQATELQVGIILDPAKRDFICLTIP